MGGGSVFERDSLSVGVLMVEVGWLGGIFLVLSNLVLGEYIFVV